jgi:hypothetical protein
MSKDPGQNIRTEQMYRELASDVFKNVNAWIDTKPLRIPYVMIFSSVKSDNVYSIRSLHFDFGG